MIIVAGAMAATMLVPSAIGAQDTGCTAQRDGDTVTLTWADNGGIHIVRRNGSWLASPGSGVDTYVDTNAPADATYLIRTWLDTESTDTDCVEGEPPPPDPPPPPPDPPPPAEVERVIHISIDGLRSDHVTATLMPELTTLITQSAATLNARTDADSTQTLPMHASQFTSRPVNGPSGHLVDFNNDNGSTIHAAAGTYVASAFDVVHDNGGFTLLYAGKSKFDFLDRSWNQVNGAPDVTGIDDGRDKIDDYRQGSPGALVQPLIDVLATTPDFEFGFFHIRTPDEIGHISGWASPEYEQAVTDADTILGTIVDAIEADPDLATTTAIIVTSDHGGPTDEFLHYDPTITENYTVPFVVWVPGTTTGTDLYALNSANRVDPGSSQPSRTDPDQPIRTSEVGNLALALLGYASIPGSVENGGQDLRLD